MAEAQSAHRREIEKHIIERQQVQTERGQQFGLIVALAMIIAAVFVTIQGYPWVGGTICGGTIIGLVSVFVIGKKNMKESLRDKRPVMETPDSQRPTSGESQTAEEKLN